MNRSRFFIAFLFINACFTISALAQVPAAPPKVAFIDTGAFYDEKVGITKLVNVSKQLDTEFAVKIKELQDGGTKLQTIANDIATMQKLPQNQFNQVAFNTKQEEGENLQRELTYKKTELETAIKKRRDILVAPISAEIGKAIDEYAKKNGYGVILDIGKFAEANAVLYFAEAADATKDFIVFFNARPATPK